MTDKPNKTLLHIDSNGFNVASGAFYFPLGIAYPSRKKWWEFWRSKWRAADGVRISITYSAEGGIDFTFYSAKAEAIHD